MAQVCLTWEGQKGTRSPHQWMREMKAQPPFCSKKSLILVIYLQHCHHPWPWKSHFFALLLCLSTCKASWELLFMYKCYLKPSNYSCNLQSFIIKFDGCNFDLKLCILSFSHLNWRIALILKKLVFFVVNLIKTYLFHTSISVMWNITHFPPFYF